MTEKPLFIPLRTEWFRGFEDGSKDTEYRAYGPRWNERTCRVGRKATISHGYSGKRLERTVTAFKVLDWAEAPDAARAIYPDAAHIAAIHMPDCGSGDTCAGQDTIDETSGHLHTDGLTWEDRYGR